MADLSILPTSPIPAPSARSGTRSLSSETTASDNLSQNDQDPFQAVLAQEMRQPTDGMPQPDNGNSAALKDASGKDEIDQIADGKSGIAAMFPAFTLLNADGGSAQVGFANAMDAAKVEFASAMKSAKVEFAGQKGLAPVNISAVGDLPSAVVSGTETVMRSQDSLIAGDVNASGKSQKGAGILPITALGKDSDPVRAAASLPPSDVSGQISIAVPALASGVDRAAAAPQPAGRSAIAQGGRQTISTTTLPAASHSSAVDTAAEFAGSGKFVPAAGDILGDTGFAEYLTEKPQQSPSPSTAIQGAASISAAPSSPPSPVPVATVEPRLGTAGWDRALGDRMVWMAGGNHQVAQLHLNPPDLGPLQITLTIDHDQASAQFTSAHAQVREAIESAMPRLREMLADSGITLGNASVSADLPREQSQPQMQRDARGYPAPSGNTPVDAGFERRGTHLLHQPRGLVDTFA